MNAAIAFRKMNGLGNDFVIIDGRSEAVRLSPEMAAAIAGRQRGIGCDQIIVLEPSGRADVFMRILNADGSESGACGNATRCVAQLIGRNGEAVTIETRAGVLRADLRADGQVSVDMGEPRFGWADIPLSREFPDTSAIGFEKRLPDGRLLSGPSVVNVGNPHCIFWVEDAGSYDLGAFGRELEHHPLFPERANISLAEVRSQDKIAVRVWERGVGLTRACGTAACAVAVSAVRTGRTGRNVEIILPGGCLQIEWRADGHIIMTGPVAFEFSGILHLDGGTGSVTYERNAQALRA